DRETARRAAPRAAAHLGGHAGERQRRVSATTANRSTTPQRAFVRGRHPSCIQPIATVGPVDGDMVVFGTMPREVSRHQAAMEIFGNPLGRPTVAEVV